jgi:hypothetical protein
MPDNWDKSKDPESKKQTFEKEFATVEKVLSVIKPMEDIERLRASDRAKIDGLFNGKRPYTEEECDKHGITINVNWGEGKRIMRDATNQLNQALLHPGLLFNCSLEAGPEDKRDEWGQKFTANIHKPLQRGLSGLRHYYMIRNRNASIAMHGIGALLWANDFRWMAKFIGLEDLLIPTETYCDLTNCRYLCANQYLVPGELMEVMQGDNVKPGWNKKMIGGILDSMKNLYSEGVPPTWRDQPEAMTNIWKENKGYYYTDAVPRIRTRWFFYQQLNDPKKWYRKMILREAYGDVKPSTGFLFEEKDSFAEDIHEILSVQFGDNNYVAPLKYHAVRGLGVDLYAPIETLNRLRCEFVQSVFEHLKMYFRIQDPQDRDRLKQIVLSQYGVLPEGLNIVPRDDRHQIDPRLVEEAMGQLGEIMQTNASSYLPNQDDGKEKTMTAREANIRANQANTMVSAMIVALYMQEGFYYEEIVRRFCKKSSNDPDVKEFQKACKADGIPEEYITDPEVWRVTPERVLGGGDRSQAQQEAWLLWQNRTAFEPSVQPQIGRLVWSTVLNDPNKANLLVPMAKPESTNGTIMAESVFGTLMTGNQIPLRQGVDYIGYVQTLLRMTGSVVQRIMQQGGVATGMDEIIGLATACQNIQLHIAAIAADAQQKQTVKQLADGLAQLLNLIKAIAQRTLQQRAAAQKAGQGGQGQMEAAKTQGLILNAQTKARINEASAALKRHQKQVDFALDQQRRNIELAAEIGRENARHHMALAHENANQVMQMLGDLRQMMNTADQTGDEQSLETAA